MLDRPRSGERALLLHIGLNHPSYEDEIQEFRALAESAGAQVVGEVQARRDRPDPRFFVGPGKVDEVAAQAQAAGAELVLVNQPLRAGQERNLENALKTRVLDRNGLILDIFAQRAATFEGKLQVELAQLEHMASRLVRGWTHLERQKGGIGLRGPGETQLETDRRLVARRIRYLKDRLTKVERQREVSRKERLRADMPTVALVGYTNAGKTSLFNALSGARLEAKDQLFATLDPTVRRLGLGGNGDEVLLVDTVGFVRDLPHELVAAFRATLTETREASLLLHVIDASDPHQEDRRRQVETVLEEVGAAEVPTLRVYNKIDRAPAGLRGELNDDGGGYWVSAVTGAGLPELRDAISARLRGARVRKQVTLGPDQSRLRAQLFDWHAVRGESVDETGVSTLEVELSAQKWQELQNRERLPADSIRRKA